MNETSLSLLDRLSNAPESQNWNRLVELYEPLLRSWLNRYQVQATDAEDLLQEVLLAVTKDVAKFEHNGRPGAFRNWLKSILVNRLRKFWRSRDYRPQAAVGTELDHKLAQLEDPASELSQIWNQEHDQYVLRELMNLAEPNFAPNTWNAFCRVALEGAEPQKVAEEIGMTANAVVIAKCRVLNRLRQESAGLVDASTGFFAKS